MTPKLTLTIVEHQQYLINCPISQLGLVQIAQNMSLNLGFSSLGIQGDLLSLISEKYIWKFSLHYATYPRLHILLCHLDRIVLVSTTAINNTDAVNINISETVSTPIIQNFSQETTNIFSILGFSRLLK